jgi:hypothetical protein
MENNPNNKGMNPLVVLNIPFVAINMPFAKHIHTNKKIPYILPVPLFFSLLFL